MWLDGKVWAQFADSGVHYAQPVSVVRKVYEEEATETFPGPVPTAGQPDIVHTTPSSTSDATTAVEVACETTRDGGGSTQIRRYRLAPGLAYSLVGPGDWEAGLPVNEALAKLAGTSRRLALIHCKLMAVFRVQEADIAQPVPIPSGAEPLPHCGDAERAAWTEDLIRRFFALDAEVHGPENDPWKQRVLASLGSQSGNSVVPTLVGPPLVAPTRPTQRQVFDKVWSKALSYGLMSWLVYWLASFPCGWIESAVGWKTGIQEAVAGAQQELTRASEHVDALDLRIEEIRSHKPDATELRQLADLVEERTSARERSTDLQTELASLRIRVSPPPWWSDARRYISGAAMAVFLLWILSVEWRERASRRARVMSAIDGRRST
jgi:hypothetical protein